MRIGILAPLYKPISRHAAGGMEVFCDLLAQGLTAAGHTVTAFVSGDSSLTDERVKVVPVVPRSYEAILRSMEHGELIQPAYRRQMVEAMNGRAALVLQTQAAELDIIHDNMLSPIVAASSMLFNQPILSTLHLPVEPRPLFLSLPSQLGHPVNELVPISRFQSSQLGLPASSVIYNGIDVQTFTVGDGDGDYLSWFARVTASDVKGLEVAVTIASQVGAKLLLGGAIAPDDESQRFFQEKIQPKLSDLIQRVEPKDQAEKNAFFGNARALLMPVNWEECLPLVPLESMATGTPVIAFARGATPEIIADGVTGYVVNPSDDDIRGNFITKETGMKGLESAVKRLYAMPENEYRAMRLACRARVEEHFTVERMVNEYIQLYGKLVAQKA